LDDGTAGLWAIADQGGATIAQNPDDAEYPSMPRSAIANVPVQHTVPASELAALLNRLTQEEVDRASSPLQSHLVKLEEQMAKGSGVPMSELAAVGVPSLNTCPHCNGVLLRVAGTAGPRFRCHTGHAFTPTSLLVDLDATIEDKLWQILRSIDERIILLRQLRDLASNGSDESTAQEYARQIEDAMSRGQAFRQMLQQPAGFRAAP
ncbi:MAG: hypothetical protein JOZ12_14145, partial [Sinobacteraceae bacterium]|nr:hypothetical protein [Nevskiaceae bacterium]